MALHTSGLDRTHFSKHRNVSSSLPFTCMHKGLRTRHTTRVFHFEVTTSQDVITYVHQHNTYCAKHCLATDTAKAFPLLTFPSFITICLVFIPFILQFHTGHTDHTAPYRPNLRNAVTCLRFSSKLITPFSAKHCYNS